MDAVRPFFVMELIATADYVSLAMTVEDWEKYRSPLSLRGLKARGSQ